MPLGLVLLALGILLTLASTLALAVLAWRAGLIRSGQAMARSRSDLASTLRSRDRLIADLLDLIEYGVPASPRPDPTADFGSGPGLGHRPGAVLSLWTERKPGASVPRRKFAAGDTSRRPTPDLAEVRAWLARAAIPSSPSDPSSPSIPSIPSAPSAPPVPDSPSAPPVPDSPSAPPVPDSADLGPDQLTLQTGLAEAMERLLLAVGPAALSGGDRATAELVRRLDQLDDQISRAQVEANAEIRDHNARLTSRLSQRLLAALPTWLSLPADLTEPVAQLEPSLAPAAPAARPSSARRALGESRGDWDD